MKNLMVQLQIIEKKILEEWRAKAMPTTPLRQCKLLAANTPAPCDRLETGNYLVPSWDASRENIWVSQGNAGLQGVALL